LFLGFAKAGWAPEARYDVREQVIKALVGTLDPLLRQAGPRHPRRAGPVWRHRMGLPGRGPRCGSSGRRPGARIL